MAAGLERLGVEQQLLPDGLWIRGAGELGGGTIDSSGDHRIAMAFAVASLKARAPIEILAVANEATSFPGVADTARAAGLRSEALGRTLPRDVPHGTPFRYHRRPALSSEE